MAVAAVGLELAAAAGGDEYQPAGLSKVGSFSDIGRGRSFLEQERSLGRKNSARKDVKVTLDDQFEVEIAHAHNQSFTRTTLTINTSICNYSSNKVVHNGKATKYLCGGPKYPLGLDDVNVESLTALNGLVDPRDRVRYGALLYCARLLFLFPARPFC